MKREPQVKLVVIKFLGAFFRGPTLEIIIVSLTELTQLNVISATTSMQIGRQHMQNLL